MRSIEAKGDVALPDGRGEDPSIAPGLSPASVKLRRLSRGLRFPLQVLGEFGLDGGRQRFHLPDGLLVAAQIG